MAQRDVWYPTSLEDGSPAVILMREVTVDRLAETCFRGMLTPLAGNFRLWGSFKEMIEDPRICRELTQDMLRQILKANDFPSGSHRLEISCPYPVGWSSTADWIDERREHSSWFPNDGEHDPLLLESCVLSKRATALRVRTDRSDIKAPLDTRLTLVYELKFEEGVGWVAVVWTVYPGRDIGKLDGDLTEREDVVFFSFNHPGASVSRL